MFVFSGVREVEGGRKVKFLKKKTTTKKAGNSQRKMIQVMEWRKKTISDLMPSFILHTFELDSLVFFLFVCFIYFLLLLFFLL